MKNPFPYSLDNKRYQTWNYYLKNRFGQKVYKVPLSLATTCPNRDGTKGFGGCTFCANGGGGTPYRPGTLQEQFLEAQIPLENKWPNSLAMPYFQSFSNTYVPPKDLSTALKESLTLPKTVGICVATRPDCLSPEILDILEEIQQETFLMIELGLQTVHQSTAERIHRGHSYDEFLQGYYSLVERNIPVCIHLINGLPNETPEMMLKTVKEIAKLTPHSVKFHMLHIMEDTVLANEYQKEPFPLLTGEEYIQIVCDQLELLPPTTVVQRVTGDPPQEGLIAPEWTKNKLWIRNAIDKEMALRNSYQGLKYKEET